jgi:hypothetical protein
MKGGQASPMFPTGGKKRGCGFENPEPSSPKVTCIGQVRVKTKKQGKKMRSRSKRRGEASFRRGENNPDLTRQNSQSLYQNHQNLQQECLKHRNQRWVHLPLTICEALREFSCFFPCRSSCMSNEREKEEKGSSSCLEGRGEVERERSGGGHGREGSCGAAFARWLVAYDGKGREIEVMMEHHEMEMEMDDEDVDVDGREKGERSYSQRRHIFEDLDIDLVDEKIQQEQFQGEEEVEEKEKEKGRVSICVPPKNALLLMRCRSDPVKMAALANRFWESPIHKEQLQDDNQHEHHNEVDEQDESSGDEDDEQEQEGYYKGQNIEMEQVEEEEEPQQLVEVVETMSQEEDNICEIEDKRDQEVDEEITKEDGNDIDEDKDETFTCVLLDSSHADLEKQEIEETHQEEHEEKQENKESSELFSSFSSSSSTTSSETFLASSEQENNEQDTESESENAEKVSTEEEQEEKVTVAEKEQDPTQQESDPEMGLIGSTERENGSKKEERERETLPECLLLMMCEPKLSMEVSKETWVCSTDFIRWLPERPVGKVAGGEKKVTVESSSSKPKVKVKTVQPLMQPPRSSCSFPVTGSGAGMSMATMIEQKLMGCSKSRNGYEPFVLKRCKSEPMRSATKLAPEACFWNNRKLEPHPPPASLGVGAPAGVGF